MARVRDARATRARGPTQRSCTVCYGSTGRGMRTGHATDTVGPRAVEYTQIKHPVPAPPAVSKHRPRPAQAAARPR
eukprot:92648-Prymnesium_polylepis.1